MKTPIFTDVIIDSNSAQLTEAARTPLVPEEPVTATAAVDTAELPPQFAAAIREQEAQQAIEEAQQAQQEAIEQAQQAQQAQIVKPVLDYEEQAELLVTLSDSMQQLAFAKVAEKRFFSNEERKAIRDIKRRKRNNEGGITAEEERLYADWIKYIEYRELLPYEDKEAEMLRKPLAKLLEQHQSNLDPKTALLLAALMVAAPRFAAMKALQDDLSR